MMPNTPPQASLVGADGSLRIWGMTAEQRLLRQLRRTGAVAEGRHLVLRADWVYDESLVRALAASRVDVALVDDDGGRAVAVSVAAVHAGAAAAALAQHRAAPGMARQTAQQLAGSYNDALRKREPPVLMPLSAATLDAAERRTFAGAYKGVTDLVTLYLWPRPARAVTRWCAEAGITPNQVTSASLVCVLAAMALFWTGHYAAGLVFAWLMTFLDTVDGKLARVTLQSSRWGNVYDHGIDLVHPPFWWWAWVVGLALPQPAWVLTAIVGGYVLQRVEEGVFIACFGIEIHVWKRFDSWFRLVTARRNPNLLILTAAVLAGRPDAGIVAVAVWTVVCLGVHALRLAQAALLRLRGVRLRSWLAAPA